RGGNPIEVEKMCTWMDEDISAGVPTGVMYGRFHNRGSVITAGKERHSLDGSTSTKQLPRVLNALCLHQWVTVKATASSAGQKVPEEPTGRVATTGLLSPVCKMF